MEDMFMKLMDAAIHTPTINGTYFVQTTLTDHLVCDWTDGVWEGDLRGDIDNPEIVTGWFDKFILK